MVNKLLTGAVVRRTLMLLLICLFVSSASAQETESVFERVMRTGEIRCGYALWNPLFYKEAGTDTYAGIAKDLMEALADKLALKVKWMEETTYAAIIDELNAGHYDMICTGLYHTAARSKLIDFSRPYFYSPLHAVVRSDEKRIRDYADINHPHVRISVMDGEAGSIYARQVYPKAQFVSLKHAADTLGYEEVALGKADAAFVEMATYTKYNEANPGRLKILKPDEPVGVFPVIFGLPKGERNLKTSIDSALMELLNNGTVDRLQQKYKVKPGLFLPVARPYLSQY